MNLVYLSEKEECTQGKIKPLSDTKVTEIFESINLVCAHTSSSHKWTRDEIASKVKLNVPTEFWSRYLDLLLKHSNALSTSKTDLGRAKHFFYKIHLKDSDPVYRKQFKIPEAHSDFIAKTIDDWLKLGVVRRSSSMYNSPIFCVPKKNSNGLKIVQDFW